LARALTISGVPGGFCVETPGRLRKADVALPRERMAWMFWTDADLSAFYDRADKEPRLAHCRPKAQGRMLRATSLLDPHPASHYNPKAVTHIQASS
jgi:hypothetical protein